MPACTDSGPAISNFCFTTTFICDTIVASSFFSIFQVIIKNLW